MANEQWTVEEIVAKTDSEGLDYMITDYLSADQIADPELAKLWRNAADAFAAVEAFLAQHQPEEDEPEPVLAGDTVTVAYTGLLCDSAPDIFDNAPESEHGYPTVASRHGGNLRLNLNGGRFGSDPEVYVKGEFAVDELTGWLTAIEPHVAQHIAQTLRATDAAGNEHWLTFGRGTSTLSNFLR